MIELLCRTCQRPYVPTRAELLHGPAIYRSCPACRKAEPAFPYVEATATWSERSRVWSLTVARCPFCQRTHHHGGNDGPEPSYGARASHCLTGDGGTYILVAAADATEDA